jgi:hypothetical protein
MANASGALSSAELYDPATNSWSAAGSLVTPLTLHTAIRLPSGKVLTVGGWYTISRPYAQVYDPATNSWATTTYMSTGRTLPPAILLSSGKVFVSGGDNAPSYINGSTSAELYTP